MTDIKSVCQYLKTNDNFIILMHSSPDGDAVGSAYALCRALTKLGKRCSCICCDEVPKRYSYMTDGCGVHTSEPSHVIAVDLADTKLLGSLENMYADRIELCIDHHVSNCIKTGEVLLDDSACAACELLYHVISELGCGIDANIANCLYTGIATDSGCFKYTNTTAATHVIAAELIKLGANHGEINRIMFDTKSRARLEIERMAIDSVEYNFNNKCALCVITEQMQNLTTPDELEGLTALTRQIEGVDVGLTFRWRGENRYKISVRTVEPIDASAICKRLGGGGHVRAAGCELNLPLDEAKQAVLNAVGQELGV